MVLHGNYRSISAYPCICPPYMMHKAICHQKILHIHLCNECVVQIQVMLDKLCYQQVVVFLVLCASTALS